MPFIVSYQIKTWLLSFFAPIGLIFWTPSQFSTIPSRWSSRKARLSVMETLQTKTTFCLYIRTASRNPKNWIHLTFLCKSCPVSSVFVNVTTPHTDKMEKRCFSLTKANPASNCKVHEASNKQNPTVSKTLQMPLLLLHTWQSELLEDPQGCWAQ